MSYDPYGTNAPAYGYPAPAFQVTPLPVEMRFGECLPQRRWTVLLRFFLLIPQFFVLFVLAVVAFFVLVIAWFGALFTAKIPPWAEEYLTGYLRWSARVQAYWFLLTDVYPPFSLDTDASYPVDVAFPPRDTLNRASVFFRYVLAFPALFLVNLLIYGVGLIMLFGWVAALITGRLPRSIFNGAAAIVRFSTRANAFLYMVTARYPHGLFGDDVRHQPFVAVQPSPFAPPAAGYGAPAVGYGAPMPQPGAGLPVPPYAAPPPAAADVQVPSYPSPMPPPVPSPADPASAASPGYPAPPGSAPQPWDPTPSWAPAPAQAPQGPGAWVLSLAEKGRGVVITSIVLGVVLWVAYVGVFVAIGVNSPEFKLQRAYDSLNSSVVQFENNGCGTASDPLGCQRQADLAAAQAFDTFTTQVRAIHLSPASAVLAGTVEQDSARVAGDLRQLAAATTSQTDYQAALASTSLQQDISTFQQDYNTLLGSLSP